jgi:hypothetical protein
MEDKTVITTAPPPPSEIKVRTMRSDIDSMMKSGGGAPSYQNVAVSGLSLEEKFKPPTNFVTTPIPEAGRIVMPEDNTPQPYQPVDRPVLGQEVSNAGPGSDLLPKIIVGLVALVALGVVGYFAYTIFVK